MQKATALTKPFFKLPVMFIAVIALLSSCAKTDYDGSLRNRANTNSNPQAQQQGQGQQQGRSGTNTDSSEPMPAENLPLISFTQTEVLMNSKLEARLEVQLNEASTKAVVAQIDLIDGSARHYRDFSGFMTPSRNDETVQTVIFAPGETRKSLPVIGGRVRYADTSRACNSDFMARINAMKLQGARVVDDRAKIIVPCSTDRADILPPLPTNPGRSEPLPPGPNCRNGIPMAAFENSQIEVPVESDIALARIVLDRPAEETVYIDVEASTRFRVKTFETFNERVMISRGQRSVDLRVRVKRQNICCLRPAPLGDKVTGRFILTVTSITNANMENRVADVAVKDNALRCNRSAQPPADAMPLVPPPPPQADIQPAQPQASFEQQNLISDGRSQLNAKINLNIPAPQDVTVEIETREGTAKQGLDFEPIKKTLTIYKDESSLDIPVTLIARDKCAPDAGPDAGKGGEFTLVVTSMVNAQVTNNTVTITIPEDTRSCEAR